MTQTSASLRYSFCLCSNPALAWKRANCTRPLLSPQAFVIFCGLGINNTIMYDQVKKSWAKQSVALDVRARNPIGHVSSAYIYTTAAVQAVILFQGVSISRFCSAPCFFFFTVFHTSALIVLASCPPSENFFLVDSLFFYSFSCILRH